MGRDAGELAERTRGVGERLGVRDLQPHPGWVVGTLDEAAEQLRAFAGAGADRVMLQLLLHDDVDQISLIGRELAAAVG